MGEKFDAHIDKLNRSGLGITLDKIRVGFKRLTDDAIIPTKAHPTDSGFDLYASEDVIIEPGETKIIPTGIAAELPAGYEAQVRPRSGVTAKTRLRVQLGTIDQDYRGEIGVIVDNEYTDKYNELWQAGYYRTSGEMYLNHRVKYPVGTYKIRKGDRIAQLVIQPLPTVEAYEIEGELDDTERGAGGFGSTGINEKEGD